MSRRGRRIATLVVLVVVAWCYASSALAAPKAVAPGNAKPEQFAPSAGCGCHSDRIAEWSASLHAQALVDPVFLVKLDQAQKETNGEVGAFCLKCHGPVATMTGEIGKTMTFASAEAVACTFCHQVVGLKGRPGNVSHLVEADGTRRAQIEEPAAPHAAAYSSLHATAEICGGCHNVDHPANGTHLESTYREWSESPYADEGVVCQDCHMSHRPGEVGPAPGQACSTGPQRERIYRMSFIGATVAQGDAEGATALLKSAAKLELAVPEIVAPGENASATVTITNVGAGHYLPTGLTEVREMWLSVYAENDEGQRNEIGRHDFGTELKDAKGNHPVEMWEATGIYSDDRIPPRKSVAETFSLEMPSDASQAKVVAVLNYRSAPDELAQQARVENPVTEMAVSSAVVYGSEQARADAQQEAAEQGASGDDGRGMGATPLIFGGAVLAGAIVVGVMARRKRRG
ncbi:MAG TPA: multiheme c-type cytochrome [Coriobacteriia bacterium]|nr:multiheme c-type cytochrome [Coriobacteriia bacterium]